MPQINSRLRQKIDTEVNWNKATNFIPLDGEIIIYKADENYSYERIKIGDGETTVIDLDFVNSIDANLTQSGQAADAKAVGDAIENKVDKEEGKGLSTNDYTTEEKEKLAGIDTGATKITVDSSLSSSSTNPVQNKIINSALNNKANSVHDQAASTITAGTFAGAVTAQTSSQTPATSLLRNSKLATTDTNPSYNGEICWTYG